jgi:hypothetical protein
MKGYYMLQAEIKNLLPAVELFTPVSVAHTCVRAFEGCDSGKLPPPQLAYLLKNYLVYGHAGAFPLYDIDSPGRSEPVQPWHETEWIQEAETMTTRFRNPYAPHILPQQVDFAPFMFTVTNVHHFYTLDFVSRDLVIVQHETGGYSPYWYEKNTNYPTLHHLIDLQPIEALLNHTPDSKDGSGVLLQAWRMEEHKNVPVYELLTGLSVKGLSFIDFLRVMNVRPNVFAVDNSVKK